jgi:dTDP-4-amino-4,6-dideoxygalactose transaminase
MITSSWPTFEQDEMDAVQEVLRSGRVNYWTGEQCKLFEREFAAYHGRAYGIALANGTLALELALYAFDIQEGDEVIVPSRTFIATASAVVARGATPVVADVDRDSGNMTVSTIDRVKTPRTKAIIVVHLAGFPCQMDEIMSYAKEHKLLVIEDCAQAHGAVYHGQKIGGFGDAAAFSFCQDKIMTTGGEGGMLLLNDEMRWKKAWAYKDHGKGYDTVHHQDHPNGFRWLHEQFGTNWRMTEMQAAIGRLQLQKLDRWIDARNQNADVLYNTFNAQPLLRTPRVMDDSRHAYYKFYTYIRPEMLAEGWTRDRIIDEIKAQGVSCFSGSCSEIYLERAFLNSTHVVTECCSVAKDLGETSLMFLVDHTFSKSDITKAAEIIVGVVRRATAG